MKKIISIVLSLAIVMSASAAAFAAEKTPNEKSEQAHILNEWVEKGRSAAVLNTPVAVKLDAFEYYSYEYSATEADTLIIFTTGNYDTCMDVVAYERILDSADDSIYSRNFYCEVDVLPETNYVFEISGFVNAVDSTLYIIAASDLQGFEFTKEPDCREMYRGICEYYDFDEMWTCPFFDGCEMQLDIAGTEGICLVDDEVTALVAGCVTNPDTADESINVNFELGEYKITLGYPLLDYPIESARIVSLGEQTPVEFIYGIDGFFYGSLFTPYFFPNVNPQGITVEITYTDGTKETVQAVNYKDGYCVMRTQKLGTIDVWANSGICIKGENTVYLCFGEEELPYTVNVISGSLQNRIQVIRTIIFGTYNELAYLLINILTRILLPY